MDENQQRIKLLKAYEAYEHRIHTALLEQPAYQPWVEGDRASIQAEAYRLLGIREAWIPNIEARTMRVRPFEGYAVHDLRFSSWPGVVGTAHWYVPTENDGDRPLALLFCGHGKHCKNALGYQAMARRLAKQGMLVLVPDNMGQGEREPMGHTHVMGPFDAGLTFQGMLAMEGMALLRWAVSRAGVDKARVCTLGNSGGGALSMLVGAFSPEAVAVAPSGYPNSFEAFLRKDKVHCACNILPNMLGRLEMWHILSLIAPRKLFMFQGSGDHLFPQEVFLAAARKVETVYECMGAESAFRAQVFPGNHSWDVARRYELSAYFADLFSLPPAEVLEDDTDGLLTPEDTCLEIFPEDANTTDELAADLLGRKIAPRPLWEIFPLQADLEGVDTSQGRGGDHRRIFAQYEAALCRTWNL